MHSAHVDSEFAFAGGAWPADGLERVDACPVCGSTNRELLHDDLWDHVFHCAPGTWTLYRCAECGAGYLDPRPTPETIGLAYSQYFTHSDGEQEVERMGAGRRFRRALSNGYRNARFGTDLKPTTRLGYYAVWLFPRRRVELEAGARSLPYPKRGQTLLDVGCGNGTFLEIAGALGWDAAGIEPDPKAVEVCRRRGLKVYQGDIRALEGRVGCYDVITLNHVIEHVHAPVSLLGACFRLLKPRGLLWIATPNLGSAGHSLYGPHWRGLEAPRHLVLFTWSSLEQILTKCGFRKTTPLPARSEAFGTFPSSEAIRRGEEKCEPGCKSPGVRFQAWRADYRSKKDRMLREFITLTAVRPEEGASKTVDSEGGAH